jgi:hypothetical protein
MQPARRTAANGQNGQDDHGLASFPTPAGNQLRHAARLISAYAYLTGDRSLTPVVLLVRLAALAEAPGHRQARHCYHTSPAETIAATPRHRRRTRGAQLPHHAPPPRARPARSGPH